MSDQDPTRPTPAADTPTPEAPTPEEGMRPGADATVRPEQQEPNGPLQGLVASGAADVREEAAELAGTEDPEAEALLAQMGVEEEGIASGQLLGLVLVVLLSVAALAVVLIYLFIIPARTQSGRAAEGSAQNYEQADLRAEATALLDQYSRTDDTYGLPIRQAMGLVAAEYGGAGAAPVTRQQWNLLVAEYGVEAAVQDAPETEIETALPFRPDLVEEEVGVDLEGPEADETAEPVLDGIE